MCIGQSCRSHRSNLIITQVQPLEWHIDFQRGGYIFCRPSSPIWFPSKLIDVNDRFSFNASVNFSLSDPKSNSRNVRQGATAMAAINLTLERVIRLSRRLRSSRAWPSWRFNFVISDVANFLFLDEIDHFFLVKVDLEEVWSEVGVVVLTMSSEEKGSAQQRPCSPGRPPKEFENILS